MASIAESCTHVGALLFKVEVAVWTLGIKTVTDFPAYWMMPGGMDEVQPQVGFEIECSSGAAKTKAFDKCISGERGRSGTWTCLGCNITPKPTHSNLSALLKILHTQNKAVFLYVMD